MISTKPQTEARPAPAAANRRSPAPFSWGARGSRDQSRMKLLGALRGEGVLMAANLTIPAHYELDVYARGATQTASGHLEGEFSGFPDLEPDAGLTGRLRLEDGREIEIDLTDLDAEAADFEAHGPLVSGGLLPA